MPLPPSAWSELHDIRLGVAHRFHVHVSGIPLGAWSKVDGLGFTIKTNDVGEAGINTYKTRMMDRPVWDDIKLSRGILAGDEWMVTYNFIMRSMTKAPGQGSSRSTGDTLTIAIMSAWGDPVRTLHFTGARIIGWKGPSLAAGVSTAAVATETVTFCHEGLFPTGQMEL